MKKGKWIDTTTGKPIRLKKSKIIDEPSKRAHDLIKFMKNEAIKKNDFDMAVEWRRIEKLAFPKTT